MKGKRLSLLVLGCMLMLPFVVKASETPVYDAANNNFYANGTPIVIDEKDGNTVISWKDGLESVVVSERTTVFGGGIAGTSFESASIVMNGGTIANLNGGGCGTATESADVESVNIVFNGGTLKSTGAAEGNLMGGGLLASNVGKVTIDFNAGTVSSIMGGGMASYNNQSTGNKADPENSKTRVNDATININGGTVLNGNLNYGLVYGGGQGYSYTKKATVNVSGSADLSKAWLVGGGSNGRTDDATINVNGGTINVIQTINRGSMINAKVNFKKGTVNKLFVGGEDPEAFDKDIVNGGFLGNIIVDITGGTVKELNPGSNYEDSIEPNSDYVMVFYKADSVTNASSIEGKFGTSAKAYITEDGYDIVNEQVTEDVDLDENLFGALAETNNVYTLIVDKADAAYSWVFDGSTITDPTIRVNTEITFTEEAPERIREDISSKVTDLKDVMYLNLAHHGALPGEAAIVYYVGDVYEDGTKLYVRHYNEDSKKLEDFSEVTVTDGVITLEINSCSSYVLSTTKTAAAGGITPPATFDNILYLVGFLLIGVVGTTVASKKLLKNN